MPSPVVSVIVPTYNAADYLQTGIESILNQTFDDFEVIVVDDGSTDGTLDVLDSYDDERIRVIQREDEQGVTTARNRGIKAARGKYIAQHDADDYSEPERFERQVEYLDAHEDVALLGTGATLVNERRGVIGRRRVLERPALDALIDHNHYVQGSVMMRADALDAVGNYDELFEVTEDYDLWLRLAAEYPVRNLDEPLYNFRIHDASLYAEEMRPVKLYHALAVMRVRGEASDALIETVRNEGVDAVYDVMPDDLKQSYHEEMGQELIRYGNLSEGRDHCLSALRVAGYTAVMPWLMVFLSLFGASAAEFVGTVFRKVVVNPRIKSDNEAAPA